MSSPEGVQRRSLEALLGELEGLEAWPETGAVAGLITALATELIEAVARDAAETWAEAGGAIAQAVALRDRAIRLGCENAEAYTQARAALAAVREPGGGKGTGDERQPGRAPSEAGLGRLLARAAEVPLALCETTSDAADLAALAAAHVKPESRADAAGAALVAAGAGRAAAHLVEINLSMRPDDERIARARRLVEQAGAASERALAASS
jgi:formiminotetrahydrofolate cyclodeaminase